MRVLLVNQVFYPDVAATAQHADDLARHLVRHGHEVHAIASRSIYGKKGATLPRHEVVEGVHIHRVGKSLFGKSSIIARLADFALFYVAAFWKALRTPKPDVVVCFTTPPFISLVGWLLRVLRGSKYVYWVMDLYPDVAVACGVVKPASPITRLCEKLNRFCLKRADEVVVLGRCMRQRVLDKGIAPDRVHHIGVWSDADEVAPLTRAENPYTERWNLADKFVLMYSGNFGLAHDVKTMLGAAEALRDDDRFLFLFVGGGKRKDEIGAFVDEKKLTTAVVADYQPRDQLHASLSSGDAHFVSMIPGAEGTVVPCKLFGIMAAGRPTVFIGPPESELALVLAEHDAGVVVEPGDVPGLVNAIRELADNRGRTEQMGANARLGLRATYGREMACEAWRSLLESLTIAQSTPPAARPDTPREPTP
jgi:glycosyltransferase involved in cell wall biosynthesis